MKKPILWVVFIALSIIVWTLELLATMFRGALRHVDDSLHGNATKPTRRKVQVSENKARSTVFEVADEAEAESEPKIAKNEANASKPKLQIVPQDAPKHNKAWGCSVEAGWTVKSVMAKDGMRIETNDKTGIERLVHTGTGQVIQPDLSVFEAGPLHKMTQKSD